MSARVAAPKPTTAFLLSEVQIIGISRSPRGYAAIVEAMPIKLAYVIYPGERFYDGQLVAIEDNRLVFRRETVFYGWTTGTFSRNETFKTAGQHRCPCGGQNASCFLHGSQNREETGTKAASGKP